MRRLLRAWDLREPVEVRPVTAGTNNTSYYLGDDFVLRIHKNKGFLDYEHAVLRALGGLSFAVPVPVPTVDGQSVVEGELDGQVVLASLARRIPGEHPQRGDVVQAEICGSAHAELDRALAELDSTTLPPRAEWNRDLERVHPRVPSLPELIAQLPVARQEEVASVLRRVATGPELPRQLIHGDVGVTNTLMVGERVTGILDLEFVGPGYRAMDLATGLWSFGRDEWPGPRPWPATEAFQQGYLATLPLTSTELAALPDLHLLREAIGFVHWFGRHLDGHAVDISARIDRLLELDELLRR